MNENLSLFPESWVAQGAPDIKIGPNMDENIDNWLRKEKQYEKTAKNFLSNKGISNLEIFQEELKELEAEIKYFDLNSNSLIEEELPIKTTLVQIPETNNKYFYKVKVTIPEEIYPHFLQWARELSKVELRKKGFKIPLEYICIWNGKEQTGSVSIPAPSFRKLPKGLGVNSFGCLDMQDIERYGLDEDIQNMYNELLGNWEEFSKYLGSLKPGEIPQKPEWMSVEQWADIKAMAMKESWDEQIAFNNKMVQPIPEEVALAMFELQKRNKQTETKSDGNNGQAQAPQQ